MTVDIDDSSVINNPFLKALSRIESTYEDISGGDNDGSSTELNNEKALASACIITLCKILDNIILEKKYNPKTRSIKLSNKLFKDKVGKVLGGVDILMACKFTYNTVQSEQGHSSIQLKKRIEDRNTLVIGRKYLDVYGRKLLNLKLGKKRNELPEFVIKDNIDQKALEEIESAINSLVRQKFRSLENEISSIIGDDSLTLDMKEMNVSNDDKILQGKDSLPSTPETEPSSNTEEDKGDVIESNKKNNRIVSSSYSLSMKNGISGAKKMTACYDNGAKKSISETSHGEGKDKRIMENINPIVVDDRKEVDHKANNVASVLDDVIKNKSFVPIHELHQAPIMDDCEKDMNTMSLEEKKSLDKISKLEDHGKEEDEMIISIIDGKVIGNTNLKPSRTFELMKKLRNITSRQEEKEEKEEEKKVNMEEASIVTYTTQSEIRIKDTEVLQLKFTGTKPKTISEEHEVKVTKNDQSLDIDSIKIDCGISQDDEVAIKLGLNLFFLVLIKVFKESNSIVETYTSTPLEILYRLWGAILRSELELKGIKTNHILEAFRKVVANDENDVTTTKQTLSLTGDDLKICNFICNTLTERGFVNLEVVTEGSMEEESNFCFTYKAIKVCEGSTQQFEKNIQTRFDDLVNKSSKWHDIIVQGCSETLQNMSSSHAPLVRDMSSSGILSLWYATRLLPYHMFAAGCHKGAVSLLLDTQFTMHRFQTCGYLLGTRMHLKDAELVIHNVKENVDQDVHVSNDVDHGKSAFEAVHDKILSMLEERKKEIGITIKNHVNKHEMNLSTKNAASDVGCALHHLGVSIGELGMYQKEIDVYSEALRLKLVSECEKSTVAETLLCMSTCYRNLGDLWSALSRCKELLSIETEIHGENHLNISKVLHLQGIILSEMEENDDALLCFQNSLQTMKALNISSNEGVVKTLCWIGKVQRENGEFLKALDSFHTARSSMEMLVEADNLDLAEILQNIGVLYDDMDKYNESLNYLYECLRIRRLKLGNDRHPYVCETLCFIASIFRKQDVGKALTLFRLVLNMKTKELSLTNDKECRELLVAYSDVLEVAKEKLNEERKNKSLHEEIATLFFKIGNIHENLHEYNDAVSYYNKSLKIRKIRKDYNDIGNTLNSLGIAHAKRRSFKKASRCFSDSLAIRKAVLGDMHTEVAETLHNLGNCAAKQNDLDNAAIYYEQSLIIKKLKYGDSESTAKTIHNIGLVNEELGLLDDAFKYYQDSLQIRMRILDASHLDVAFSLHSIGTIHRKRNEIKEANDCFTKALQIKKQNYVVTHLSIAETMHELAITLSEGGKIDEAISSYESALSIYEENLGAHKITADILDSLGNIHLSILRLDTSYRYFERALVLKRMLFGDDDETVSDTLYLVGKVQGKSGDLDDALDSLKEALRIRKKYHDDDSLPLASVINDVGVLQLRKGQYPIALTCFTEAMRIWKLKLDKSHDYHSEALMNLAEIDFSTGEYDNAIEKLNEALDLLIANHGDRHLSVASVYFKLGLSLEKKKAHIEALDAFDKALVIRSDEYGEDSMYVAEVLKSVGAVCLDMADFAKARNYLGEALNIMTSKCPNDLDTSDTLYNLGKVMLKMKYLHEAQTYFEEALEIRNRRLQNDDSAVADIISDLAIIYEENQQYTESLSMHEKALKIRKSLLGDHESVGDSYHMMGNIEQSMNQYDAALKSFGSALVLYQTTLGDDHLSCAKTMNNIGIVYEAMNEINEALKYHREALRIRKKNLGRDHLKVANSLDNIAGAYQKQNNNDKASSALKEALRIRIANLGNDHLEVATTLFGMGIVYCDKGDLQRAMDCYEASLNIRKRKVGTSSIEVAQTLHNIGSLYAMQEDYSNALLHWKSALEKYRMTLPDDHHMVACAIGNIQMAENMLTET